MGKKHPVVTPEEHSILTYRLGKKKKKKKKLFSCPPPPAPNFWKLKEVFTVQKYTAPNFQNSNFFSLRILIF